MRVHLGNDEAMPLLALPLIEEPSNTLELVHFVPAIETVPDDGTVPLAVLPHPKPAQHKSV